jgi:hypothetical protein
MKQARFFGGLLAVMAVLLGTADVGAAEKQKDLLATMSWKGAKPMEKDGEAVVLEAQGTETPRLETSEEFTPPFKLTARVITDVTETRIQYGRGLFIFNWANKPDQIRVHDLMTAAPNPIPNKGLKAGKEHNIVIDIDAKRVTLKVDGQHIYSGRGDFRALKFPLSIGPAMGSKIKVLSFAVGE